jgi:hypothetical protein
MRSASERDSSGAMVVLARKTSLAGSRWELNVLGSEDSVRVWTWLFDLVGEAGARIGVAGAISAAQAAIAEGKVKDKDGKGFNLTPELILKALGAHGSEAIPLALRVFSKTLAEERTIAMLRTLFATLHENDRPIDYDSCFAGRIEVQFAVAWWALQENYRNFFVANPILRLISSALENGSPTPTRPLTSTGASGESSSQARPP